MRKLRHRESKEIAKGIQQFRIRIHVQDYGLRIHNHNHFSVSRKIVTAQWCLSIWSRKFKRHRSAWGFPVSSVGKESACNAGDPGSIPGSGRSPGEGKGYPLLQYSGLENSMDSIGHGVAKNWTRLSDFHTHTHTHTDLHRGENDRFNQTEAGV